MAVAWLDRYECDRDGKLPPVCMVCGAEAEHTVKRTFSWYPPWVIVTILVALLVYVILALVLTKKMTVYVPLCSEHKNHFGRRVLWGGLLIVAAFVVLIGGFVLGVVCAEQKVSDTLAMIAFIGSPLGFLVVLIVASVVMRRGVNPTEITDDDIKLKGVSDGFVDALKDQRRAKKESRDRRRAEEGDEDDRPRRRRRDDYDDDEDDDRRPRRRRYDD
jgi:hypothetical protein